MTIKDILKNQIFELLIEYIFSFLGYLFVYSTSKYGNINPIPLTGIFTLIVSITSPPKYVPLFLSSCLSSVMDYRILTNMGFIAISAFFIVLLFRISSKILLNIGGRPGVFAFIANSFNILIQWLISLSGIYEFDVNNFLFDSNSYSQMNFYVYIFGPLMSAIASLSVQLLSERINDIIKLSHRIMAYGIVTTFGSLFLLTFKTIYYMDKDIPVYYGNVYALFWNLGCLAGLTIKSRFFDYIKGYQFYHYIIIGFIGGWVHIALIGIALIGGRPGVMAFLGNLIYLCVFHNKEINQQKESKSTCVNQIKDSARIYASEECNPSIKITIK